MLKRRSNQLIAIAIFAVSVAGDAARAGALPIFGGPIFVPSIEGGRPTEPWLPRGVGNDVAMSVETEAWGIGIASVKIFRWDTSGAPATQIADFGPATTGKRVQAMNPAGTAVGEIGSVPARWDPTSRIATRLDTLGLATDRPIDSVGLAINADGVSVGYSTKHANGPKGLRAARWSASSTEVTELAHLSTNLSGVTFDSAHDVNRAGVAVGSASMYDGSVFRGTRPVRWDATGAIEELGNLGTIPAGRSDGAAYRINSSGMIAGSVTKIENGIDLGRRAVRWNAGSTIPTQLGHLGTGTDGRTNASVVDMNDAGVIVGTVDKYVGGNRIGTVAVRWNPNTTAPQELASGSELSLAINALGYVVGSNKLIDNDGKSTFLESLIDPTSGWRQFTARAINDVGFVSGTGRYGPDGMPRAFMMLVPQAGTYGRGDANFDAQVNFADLVVLSHHYNTTNTSQNVNVADFNLDGVTNFADLVKLAQHYNTGVASVAALGNASLAADWALAQSMVPEPTALLAITTLLPLVRRRR